MSRDAVKYVLAVSSAAVVSAGAFLFVSAKPAGANILCSMSTCEGGGTCVHLGGQNCASQNGSCASTKCPP